MCHPMSAISPVPRRVPWLAVADWRAGLRDDLPWLGLVLAYCLASIAVDAAGWLNVFRPDSWGLEGSLSLLDWVWRCWPLVLLVELVRRGVPGLRVAVDPGRALRAFVAALGVIVLVRTHDGWKAAIGQRGFTWDAALARLDALLHFGRAPWAWLPSSPAATVLLDRAYILWYPVMVLVLVANAWSTDRRSRRQFFLAMTLLVIVFGGGLAHLFASAGPCFYGRVVEGPDPFAPLFARLQAVDTQPGTLAVLDFQRFLWQAHAAGDEAAWYHISAMPSLHVAYAALWAIAGHRVHWSLGAAGWAYAGLIFLGSVALGWHYAIDGYVGALGAWACWWAAGRLHA